MRAMPPDKLRTLTCSRPASAIMPAKVFWSGTAECFQPRYIYDSRSARNPLAQCGQHFERPSVIGCLQGQDQMWKTRDTENRPAGFQDTACFGQGFVQSGDVAQTKRAGVHINRIVGQRAVASALPTLHVMPSSILCRWRDLGRRSIISCGIIDDLTGAAASFRQRKVMSPVPPPTSTSVWSGCGASQSIIADFHNGGCRGSSNRSSGRICWRPRQRLR